MQMRAQVKTTVYDNHIPGMEERQNMHGSKADSGVKMVDKIHRAVLFLYNNGHGEVVPWLMDCLIEAYPSYAPAHHDRAMLAHEHGDTKIASEHFRKAAELAADNAEYQKSYGDFLHVAEENPEAAVNQYRKVVVLEPEHKDALLMLAHLSTALKRLDDARNYYTAVLHLDPGHETARQCLEKLPDNPAAGVHAEATSFPRSAAAAKQPVTVDDRASELEAMRRLVREEPLNARARNDLGVMLYEKGDKDEALACYEKAAELAPEEVVFQKNLADFYFVEQGDVEKAMKKYVQTLTLDPQDTETLTATGHICMTLGNADDARVFFERVLEIEPWNQTAQELLEALDKKTVFTQPCNWEPEEDIHAKAQALASSGDAQGAIETLKTLIAREPDNALAYNDIGVLYYETGNKEAALGCYEQAARLEPDDATFQKNLADFYYIEKNRTEDALKIYIKLLEVNPGDIDCLIAAGTICMGVGKNDDARVFFDRVLELDPNNRHVKDLLEDGGTNSQNTGRAQILDFSNGFPA